MNRDNHTTLTLKDNPYQYTRAIRFRTKPQRQSKCFKDRTNRDVSKNNLPELTELLLESHTKLTSLFYVRTKDGQSVFNKKLSVNKVWLKNWHKDVFYASIRLANKKQNRYFLWELKELHPKFKEWLDEWKKYIKRLKEASENPSHSRVRRSDVASIISVLLNRTKLDYISDLLREVHSKYVGLDKKIETLRTTLQEVREKLKEAEEHYLPSQSSGIEIARTSFNYYTVNKKPKDYDTQLNMAKKKKDKDGFTTIKAGNYVWEKIKTDKDKRIFTFRSDQEKEWIKRYIEKNLQNNLDADITLSLDQTYSAMKAFKAEQKSIFNEIMTHIASKRGSSYKSRNDDHLLKGYDFSYRTFNQESINKMFSLFELKPKDKRMYDEFMELTKNIQQRDNKKQRGKLFFFGKDCYFKKYRDFCQNYRKVAQERGRLIAQIKGIEKEKQDAEQTSYWSLFYVNNDSKQLWLIPKDKMQRARDFYDSLCNKQGKNYKTENTQYLCCFVSLTTRALHKLCFAEQSSFVKGMPNKLKELQKSAKTFKTDGNERKLKAKHQKQLKLYKELLQDGYAEDALELGDFDLTNILKAKNLEEFEKSLEDACYKIKRINLNKDDELRFLKDFDVTVLGISSYDLEGRNKFSDKRYHTELWQAFWDGLDNPEQTEIKGFKLGKVRLNPEVKIRYRKTDNELKEYFKKRHFDNSFKHRRLEEQFTAGFTLALNAGKKYEELAFSKPEEIVDKINDFNNRLNNEMNFKTAWKYGIDRGNIELATLCLVRFNPDNEVYEEKGKKIVKPFFPRGEKDIKCYTLKDYDRSERYTTKQGETRLRKAINNLSYFIDDEKLFSMETVSCLDLTTAKVIKGKIVTNGDVMTYLKLKKTAGKRKLYEFKHEIEKDSKLEWSIKEDGKDKQKIPEGVLNIKTHGGEKTIYWYQKKYSKILSKERIETDFNRYLNELLNADHRHTPTILQINNLRDAITANMVGVICHLQKTYPGFVILEDLSSKTVETHFAEHNENISRRLENALYNKFQTLGLVPPHVKDIIRLREDIRKKQNNNKKQQQGQEGSIRSSQIGTIIFTDETNTSKNCPYCEEKQNRKEGVDEKFQQHRFICGDGCPCGFDTYHFKGEQDKVPDHKPEVDTASYKSEFNLFQKIDDPDKVAAYNVAKKIKTSREIGKMKNPLEQPSQ